MSDFTELNCCGMAELFHVNAPLPVLREAVESKLGENPNGDCTPNCADENCASHQDAMDAYPAGSGFLIASTVPAQRKAVKNLKLLGFRKLPSCSVFLFSSSKAGPRYCQWNTP